jgi:hypothetical protein
MPCLGHQEWDLYTARSVCPAPLPTAALPPPGSMMVRTIGNSSWDAFLVRMKALSERKVTTDH